MIKPPDGVLTRKPVRTNHFTSRKLRRTVAANGTSGIQRSQHLQACKPFTSLDVSTYLTSRKYTCTQKTHTHTFSPVHSYILTLIFKRIFVFKCTLPLLRLTPLLMLLALPVVLTRLVSFHKRIRPPLSLLDPALDAVALACFPIAWFFGFLYYTDVPSLAFVVATVVLARQERHWTAALVREFPLQNPILCFRRLNLLPS